MFSRVHPNLHSLRHLPGAIGLSSLLTVTVSLAAFPTLLVTRAAQAEPPLPSVGKVLDDYIAATGGKAAYLKITSTETKSAFEMKAQKIKAEVLTRAKAPDKIVVTQNIPGIGKIEQGYDGKTGWARDPLHGLRTLSGKELAQLRAQARFNGPLYWKELYTKSQMLGIRTVNGAQAFAVRLTAADGQFTTQYYDVKTKLLVRMDQIAESPEGALPTEAYLSDYRLSDGIKAPFSGRQVIAGVGEATLTTTSIKNNVPLDDAIFAKPAADSTPALKPAK